MDLNPSQNEAVHTLSGPLLVLAGAGTGKTRVVTYRIAELIATARPPRPHPGRDLHQQGGRRNAAAGGGPAGQEAAREKPEISTFHSLCVRDPPPPIRQLGYPAAFAIYDRGDQESVARAVLREIKVADGLLRPGDLLYFIGRWKTAAIRPEQAAADGPDRQGAPGRGRLSPLSERAEGRRRRRFRRPAAAAPRSFSRRFPKVRAGRGRPLRPPADRRIPGHQRQPVPHRQGPGRRASQPVRGGRRRPVDLRLARGRSDAHPALQARLARRQNRPPGSQLPLHRSRSSPGPTD